MAQRLLCQSGMMTQTNFQKIVSRNRSGLVSDLAMSLLLSLGIAAGAASFGFTQLPAPEVMTAVLQHRPAVEETPAEAQLELHADGAKTPSTKARSMKAPARTSI